jgi:hypothetical protein|tara:strand:- start:291 stop:497 length:207 start_codon:yes stop_codon:yes gene_type:complete
MVSEKGKYVEEDLSSAVQCDQSQRSSSFTIGEKGEIGSLAFQDGISMELHAIIFCFHWIYTDTRQLLE